MTQRSAAVRNLLSLPLRVELRCSAPRQLTRRTGPKTARPTPTRTPRVHGPAPNQGVRDRRCECRLPVLTPTRVPVRRRRTAVGPPGSRRTPSSCRTDHPVRLGARWRRRQVFRSSWRVLRVQAPPAFPPQKQWASRAPAPRAWLGARARRTRAALCSWTRPAVQQTAQTVTQTIRPCGSQRHLDPCKGVRLGCLRLQPADGLRAFLPTRDRVNLGCQQPQRE
mmetsp:Transcript_54885/g.146540  ORF Transcript_54885/g.146540 Transcript_54885/m.146540 type:complete len:223 (-) Transcript_54885:571-1239(-)